MKELVAQTGFDCVVSSLHGDQLLDTHREYGSMPPELSYGRGRPRPLFRGGAPKVILAGLPTAQLHRIFDAHQADIAAAGLPTDWPAFRRYYSQIRKSGFYFSEGELEAELAAMAVPLQQAGGTVIGALSLVTTVQRMAVIDRAKLTPLIQRAAREISARLH
jgi:DNA-binding IclR family transcriptional regulator